MSALAEKIEHTRIQSDYKRFLKELKPELFELGSQALQMHKERNYGAIWVDDKGGRLPGLFVRRVIQNAGLEVPPTYFVMAGRKAQLRYDYTKEPQFDRLAPEGSHRRNGLIVTDTVHLGRAIGFLAYFMSDRFEAVDVASVAITGSALDRNRNVGHYIAGGYGSQAIKRTNAAFESVLFAGNTDGTTTLRHFKNIILPKNRIVAYDHDNTYPTGGVDCSPAPGSIHAQRSADTGYRDTAVFAREQIYSLADEFGEQTQ